MKQLIILSLLLGLASNLLLHSQAVKVTDSKEVQIGKGDPQITSSGFSADVHTLTFGDGNFSKSLVPPANPPVWPIKTNWDWGIQYADRGLAFIYSKYEYCGYPTPPYTRCEHRYPRLLFLSDSLRVGIYNSNPQYTLDVNGIIHASSVITTSSDKRLKKDISPLFTNIYDLNKLNSVTYKRNYLESEQEQILNRDTNTHYGFIAQELREIYPELVFEDEKGYLSVNYIGMIPVLVNAIKELNAKNDELNSKIVALESHNLLRNNTDVITTSAVLYQNNPNPFSERTEIKYYIPAVAVNATLCVYDLNGSQILKMDIAGRENGSISINANQLRASMYLYTLLVDDKEVDTKKMILTGE